jgi:uroporphyrin-3 C-methyltransferase
VDKEDDIRRSPGIPSLEAATDPEKQESAPPVNAVTNKPRRGLAAGMLLLGFFVVGLMAAGYLGWRWLNQQLPRLAETQAQQALMLTTLGRQLEEERDARLRLGAELERAIGEFGLQLNAQSKRLEDLSTTSRDDWLLAEAEYLLRLANQRLLTERQSKGALVLMTAVDDIVGGIDDTRLFPVRQVLSEEITALRLTGGVDREGLYLRLAALAEVVMQLQPTEFADLQVAAGLEANEQESADLPWYRQLAVNALAAIRRFGAEHFRVKTLDKPLEPLLSPDQDAYLQHNIRLGIEQAQLSLLREEQEIYTAGLDKAETWLRTYFSMNADAEVVANQLALLKTESVVQKLPDISRSLAALRDYINLRHRRDPQPSAAGDAVP